MKRVLLSAVLLISALGIHAQHEPGILTLQPKIGATASHLTYFNFDGSGNRFAPTAGVELEYQILDRLSTSVGVQYTMQGCRGNIITQSSAYIDNGYFSYSATVNDYHKTRISMDYLSFPVVLNYYIFKGLAVKVGIQPSYLMYDHAKIKSKYSHAIILGSNVKEGHVEECYNTRNFHKFNLSMPVGLSYEFDGGLVLDLRYNYPLTNVFDMHDEERYQYQITYLGSVKHQMLQFTVGYKFE